MRLARALLVAALLPAAAAGQDVTDDTGGEMLDPAPRAAADPFAACSTEPWQAGGVETSCDVVEAIDLMTPVEAWLLRYRRSAELPEGDVTSVVEIEELALIEASGGGYRVLWRLPADLRFESLGTVSIAQLGAATVVSYWACLQGTGGCTQQFLMRDGGWSILAQPYLADLAALAPPDWSLHKGREIDLGSLTGVQPLAGPEDPNCCPSGSIRFSLALQGGALVLLDAEVQVPEPEPEPEPTPADTADGGARPPAAPLPGGERDER
jgi:hypothetical protein